MAGVSLAWLLNGQRAVILTEARHYLADIQTIQLELSGQAVAVDVGAHISYPNLYPFYIRVLTKLRCIGGTSPESHAFLASISSFEALLSKK